MSDEPKPQLPAAVHKYLSQLGRKGGKAGSKEDKSKAGKIGMRARYGEKKQGPERPAKA